MRGLIKDRNGISILEARFHNWKVIVASDWSCMGPHEQAMGEEPESFYGDLLPILREADLAIVNVETSLGELGKPVIKDGPNLRISSKMVQALSIVPFHVACLANNHVRDFGAEGLKETIRLLREAGLITTGAGCNEEEIAKPAILEIGDISLGVLNIAEGEESLPPDKGAPGVAGMDLMRIEKQFLKLKDTVDIILVIAHGGREHAPAPPPYIQKIYRQIIRLGADIVIGHHPHVPQGIEIYHGCPIVYSLGNFAFWQGPNPYFHLGYLVELEFKGSRLANLVVIPYKILPDGLSLLTDEEEKIFYAELEMISRLLYDSKKVDELWEAFVDINYKSIEQSEIVFDCSNSRNAAIARNQFNTMAHSELMITMMERVRDRTIGSSPGWAKELVRRWRGVSD